MDLTYQATTQAPPTIHALDLPEIVLQISLYLDATDVFACYSTSRSLRISFAPFVWQELHFGRSCDIWCNDTLLGRHLDLQDSDPMTMDTLKRAAPWVKSLKIHRHDSILPLKLGELCSGIERIDLRGLTYDNNKKDSMEHWKSCQEMIGRNQGRLKYLFLSNWTFAWRHKYGPEQPRWNPLVGGTKCLALRSLSLKDCEIRGRYMMHFWNIGQRLESLELNGVTLDLAEPCGWVPKPTTAASNSGTVSATAPVYEARFPRLQELVLKNTTQFKPRRLMDLLVTQCPALRTLYWEHFKRFMFPFEEFTELFSSMTWPKLDSITLKKTRNYIPQGCYYKLLTDPRQHHYHRPLRRLYVERFSMMKEIKYNLLRDHHFSTLETINIVRCWDVSSPLVVQILTSCPSLQRLKAKFITAQEILDSGPSWVCHGLQKLSIIIDMAFQRDTVPIPKFTEQEMDQCRAVFKQLATLTRLRVLDMLMRKRRPLKRRVYVGSRYEEYEIVPLPMRLKAGMDQLSRLTELRKVTFWSGRQATYRKEVLWMLDHWKWLKKLQAFWTIRSYAENRTDKDFHSGSLYSLLANSGISTSGSMRCHDRDDVVEDDCCGETCW